MRMRSHLFPVLAAATLALGGCGGASEPVVGVVLPFTGEAAPSGEHIREGINLAVEDVNAAGGVDGQPLKVLFEDSATDDETGKAAARKLIEQDHVLAVIGGATSSVTMAILEDVCEPAQVVLLSPAASSPNLSGKSPYFLRVYPSDILEAARMADMAGHELRLRKLVIFAEADEYGRGYKKALMDRYTRIKNRKVIKVFNFMPGDRDFDAMIQETVGLDPDGIFLIGYMGSVSALVNDIRTAGITAPILTAGSLTEDFPAVAGAAAEGVMFSSPSFRAIGNKDQAERFIKAFKARYGREPGDYAAYGYDALRVMAQVMAGGNLSRTAIHMAIRTPASEYAGVTGNILFGNEGDVVASPTTFIISDGAIIQYKDYLEAGGAPPGQTSDGSED
ncbi:MAG: ABC transporter substrate-binding protein [Acidobacteria bacterium]|nr:ABC transporter substrate-binding protein [Acidobacteriota bacterium]